MANEPQDDDPGGGPGKEYITTNEIVLACLYLASVTIALLLGLWSIWPSCDAETMPTVTAVKPATGPVDGGTEVLVTGVGFKPDSAVSFGGSPAVVTLRGTNLIRAVAPPHEAGRVDVEVPHDCAGTIPWTTGFTYVADTAAQPAPTISPESGPTSGGTTVTISDAALTPDDTVSFDGKSVSPDKSSVPGRLVVQSPAHGPGRIDVVVIRKDKTPSPKPLHFVYHDQIEIAEIKPASGSTQGCDAATITGSGFVDGMQVSFGVVPAAAVKVNSSTSLTVLTPSHPRGRVDVVGVIGSSARLAGGYNYQCPTPDERTLFFMVMLAGGLGAALHALRSFFMYVGTRKLVQSWIWMYLLTPIAGATIAVVFYIIVGAGLFTLAGGQPGFTIVGLGALVGMFSAEAIEKLKGIAEGLFSKGPTGSEHLAQPVPTIVSVTPSEGILEGGQQVEILGTGFVAGVTVMFGGESGKDARLTGDKKITVTTPAHAEGPVDVVVFVDGKPPAKLANGFTYKKVS